MNLENSGQHENRRLINSQNALLVIRNSEI